MELEQAYRLVFDDMLHNGPTMFQGNYDARNGREHFMYGISTVMEYIAFRADSTEKTYEQFSDFFVTNMLLSEEKVR